MVGSKTVKTLQHFMWGPTRSLEAMKRWVDFRASSSVHRAHARSSLSRVVPETDAPFFLPRVQEGLPTKKAYWLHHHLPLVLPFSFSPFLFYVFFLCCLDKRRKEGSPPRGKRIPSVKLLRQRSLLRWKRKWWSYWAAFAFKYIFFWSFSFARSNDFGTVACLPNL